jgi:hypothetical protein
VSVPCQSVRIHAEASIAEMKNPKEYKKPIAASMGLLNVCYIIVSLVVYKYCGSKSILVLVAFADW